MFTLRKRQNFLIYSKIMWTIFIACFYMIGRYLLVPTILGNQEALQHMGNMTLLNSLAAVTGAQYQQITLFSLGLSPWMTTMIIWRFFTVFGWFKSLTSRQIHYCRMGLVALIAFIQAYSLVNYAAFRYFTRLGHHSDFVAKTLAIFVLMAGAYALLWLGNINGQKGLGGMSIIILVNMLLSFRENISRYLKSVATEELPQLFFMFTTILLILIVITVILYKAEYRIPIKRIGVNNAFNDESYLPIRLTPAGAMPFMYGMTMMLLPPYLISLLLRIFPENATLTFLAVNIGISRLPGAILYMILLYVLAIGFAYYNYDVYDIAKNMRNNGDYIELIRPEEQTVKFLQSKIKIWTHFGAIATVIIGGVPLLFIVLQNSQDPQHISMALLISNGYIIASLSLGIIEQLQMLMSWKKYKNII